MIQVTRSSRCRWPQNGGELVGRDVEVPVNLAARAGGRRDEVSKAGVGGIQRSFTV